MSAIQLTPPLDKKTEFSFHEISSPDEMVITQGACMSSSAPFDKKKTQRLLRKLDVNLVSLLALLYLLSFLDRSNIGNARLAGLEKSLHMSPKSLAYNNALAIFFPFYVTADIPSNLMMKTYRPSRWIPFIMVVWGAMCISLGFVRSYTGLMSVRAVLGLAEGGLFPGITYFLTCWYCRHECGLRMAIFFSAATAAGAFGGLLARAIMLMDGALSLESWRWIFILEGTATVVFAVVAFFGMYDNPQTAAFLTQKEKVEVQRRLEEDRGFLDDQFKWSYVMDAFKDWKIYIYCLITVGIFTPLYGFSLFLPTIIKDLGYANNAAQLMTVPPYVLACFCCIAGGFAADRNRQRGIFIIAFELTAVIGSIMLLGSHDNRVKYCGTFLLAAGIYPNVPAIVAWNGNNIGGSTKRSVGIAMQVAIGNLGGVVSAYMFLPKDSPDYRRGHGALIALSGGASLLSLFMTVCLRRENSRRNKRGQRSYSEDQKRQESHLGDNASFFRYTV